MSKLFQGKIPAFTPCPFREVCAPNIQGVDGVFISCGHKGVNHNVEYSCGIARGFDLIDKYQKEKQHES